MKVRDLMSYPIATIRPDVTVQTAIDRIASEKKGCLLVAKDGLLKECLGIVTTSQIFLEVFAKGLDPKNVSVLEIMTPAPLITIDLDSSTKDAADLMQKKNIRRLPVIKDGALVGIITSKDLLKCVK
jgi:CBS domain-containing protein